MSRFQRKRQKLVARSMRELLTEISNCDFSKWEKFDVIKMIAVREIINRGFVGGITWNDNFNPREIRTNFAYVTLDGYTFLEHKHPNWKSNLALVLSCVAIMMSFACAFTPFPEWVQQWISSLFG